MHRPWSSGPSLSGLHWYPFTFVFGTWGLLVERWAASTKLTSTEIIPHPHYWWFTYVKQRRDGVFVWVLIKSALHNLTFFSCLQRKGSYSSQCSTTGDDLLNWEWGYRGEWDLLHTPRTGSDCCPGKGDDHRIYSRPFSQYFPLIPQQSSLTC